MIFWCKWPSAVPFLFHHLWKVHFFSNFYQFSPVFFQIFWSQTRMNDGLETVDLWCRKTPLYQLGHIDCFSIIITNLYLLVDFLIGSFSYLKCKKMHCWFLSKLILPLRSSSRLSILWSFYDRKLRVYGHNIGHFLVE